MYATKKIKFELNSTGQYNCFAKNDLNPAKREGVERGGVTQEPKDRKKDRMLRKKRKEPEQRFMLKKVMPEKTKEEKKQRARGGGWQLWIVKGEYEGGKYMPRGRTITSRRETALSGA